MEVASNCLPLCARCVRSERILLGSLDSCWLRRVYNTECAPQCWKRLGAQNVCRKLSICCQVCGYMSHVESLCLGGLGVLPDMTHPQHLTYASIALPRYTGEPHLLALLLDVYAWHAAAAARRAHRRAAQGAAAQTPCPYIQARAVPSIGPCTMGAMRADHAGWPHMQGGMQGCLQTCLIPLVAATPGVDIVHTCIFLGHTLPLLRGGIRILT